MTNPAPPPATTRPRAGKRRLTPIWIVPLVSILIGAWLLWDTLSKRGPTITITFDSAEGLQAGQSHVRHKDVDLGLVKAIALTPDHQHVQVTAELTREADPLITDKTRFWVVKPRFFAGNLSGLGTLLSGSYIEAQPSPEGGGFQRHFTGLEEPPVLQTSTPGHVFLLKANRIGSISLGSPIYFRDLPVGEVLGWDLGDMAETVTIHAFVRQPFDEYVHDDTRFWNASGLSVKLGAEGVQVRVESIRALFFGGIEFDTPAIARASDASADDQVFPLYADEDTANRALYRRRVAAEANFQGSVAGLAAGAPVTFQGLTIGQVTSVGLEYDPKSDTIRAPVRFEIEPARIADVKVAEERGPLANARELVRRGLRAQLQSANMLTGQMLVALTIIPDAPPAELQMAGDVIVLPTAPGQLAGLGDAAGQLMAKLKAMPLDEIGKNLNETLRALKDIANGRELRQALASVKTTMTAAQQLMKNLDAGVSPAMQQLPALSSDLQRAMTQVNRLLSSADAGYGGDSRFNRELDQLMVQLNDMTRSFRSLADLLNRHPEALIRGRSDTGVE